MATVVLQQAFIMLILILIGAGCFRLHILSKETVGEISSLVLKVVNPIVIFMAYQREFKAELVQHLGWAFLLTGISYAIAALIAYVGIRDREGRETVIERFSAIYSNCGFMGIPLVMAMFGYEGVFYLTAFLTGFNAFVWSHGVMMMSGQRSLKSLMKVLRSPAIIAIVLGMLSFFSRGLFGEHFPGEGQPFDFLRTLGGLLLETLEMVGSLNTPLAMLVAGATIAQTNLPGVLKKPRIFYVSLLKLIAIPLACILVFRFLPADRTVEMTVVAASAAPSAAICTMMSLSYRRNAAYASEIFGVTTLLSIATMPLMMVVYDLIG